jgi:hypothetical protein
MEKDNKKSWMDNYRDIHDFIKKVDMQAHNLEKPLPNDFQFNDPHIVKDFSTRTNAKISIWRNDAQGGMIVPKFVYPRELIKNDLVFAETGQFEGYAYIESYEISNDGRLNNFQLRQANFSISRENLMLKSVERLIMAAQEHSKEPVHVIVGLRQAK